MQYAEKGAFNIRDAFLAMLKNLHIFAPLNPENESRADEINAMDWITESKEPPPVPCEHCGELRHYSSIKDEHGNFIMWNIYPDKCDNHECIEKELQKKQQRIAENEAISRANRFGRILEASGLFSANRRCTFANYHPRTCDQEIARKECEHYANNAVQHINPDGKSGDGCGLYIYGPYGTGKTHLISALAMSVMRMGYGVAYATDSMLLRSVRDTFGARDLSESDVLDSYCRANILFLDDLGKTKATDYAVEVIYDILNARYCSEKPTIVTSNYSPLDLIMRLGSTAENLDRAQSIVSRIVERSTIMQVTGDDYRLRALSTTSKSPEG